MCVPFANSVEVQDEFYKIECYHKNISIYTDYHSFIPTEKVSQKTLRQKGSREGVSVLVLGVDSVSRINLYRNMPKTAKYLKELGAIEMLGYNKVGDNTFPNLIPVQTGLSEEELKSSCWPGTKCVFDHCNFIWDNFSAAGHITGFGEEASFLGMFTYNAPGFHKQPTDYYMRIFDRQANRDIGFNHMLNVITCIGPRKNLMHLLNHVRKFALTLMEYLSFGFFWSASLTHDDINLPKESDEEFKQFLTTLSKQGVFENTILVFMSDHGMRFGPIRKTYQGHLEERLPLLSFLLPKWFETKYESAVNNLKKNTRRLISPFDLHETLNDLVDLKVLQSDTLWRRTKDLDKTQSLPRGISLFLPIPKKRTCESARILKHWCTCHQSEEVSTSEKLVEQATNHVVKHLNSLLEEYPQCSQLQLFKIEGARQERSMSANVGNVSMTHTDLTVTFSTDPGRGMFEAHVRHDSDKEQFKVVATVSRINAYKQQSRCIDHAHLRLYCFCKKS